MVVGIDVLLDSGLSPAKHFHGWNGCIQDISLVGHGESWWGSGGGWVLTT